MKERDVYLRVDAVENMVGLRRNAIWKAEKRGDFPRRIRLPGSNRILWSRREVQDWLDAAAAARGEGAR